MNVIDILWKYEIMKIKHLQDTVQYKITKCRNSKYAEIILDS